MFQMAILLVLLGTGQGTRVHVQFFGKENYNCMNFLKEHTLQGGECHWLGKDSDINVASIKTDGCVMLYSGTPNCQAAASLIWGNSFDITSIRVDYDMTKVQGVGSKDDPGAFKVSSFHACSRELGGGSEIDVDFYEKGFFKLQLKFYDVHGCQNVEKAFVGGKSKPININNHGNSIDLFEGEHCTGQAMTLAAGYAPNRTPLFFDVQSFRPTNYQDHMKLEASIYKFEFENGTQNMIQGSKVESVKLASDSTLRSNGASSLTQEFTVSGKVTKGMEYTIATGFSNMHTVHTSGTLETTVKTGIPLVMEGEIKTKLSLGYQYQNSDTGSTNNRTSVVSEETISSRQQINIPPCTECVVSTFVKKVKDFPIAYSAYSRITGTSGEDRMSAREIREVLRPEMKYLGDVDAYTVNATVEGTMFAEFGLNSLISADCKPIPNCESATKGK